MGHPVDHVVPLQGEFVSGLHVHYNLVVMPKTLNSWKHNKLLADAIWTLVPIGEGQFMCTEIKQ